MTRYFDPDGNPISTEAWAELFERRTRGDDDSWWRRQTRVGDHEVSTVWLGLNHRYGDGEPLFWETMVFPVEDDQVRLDEVGSDRYSSREAAWAGHERFVKEFSDD